MIKKIFLITSHEKQQTLRFKEFYEHIKVHYKVQVQIQDYKDIITDYNDYSVSVLYLSDENLKLYLKNHLNSGQKIAIMPTSDNQNAINSYALPIDIHEALDLAFDNKNFFTVDTLLCNCQITFSNIIIGDVHGLNDTSRDSKGFFSKFSSFYKNLSKLNFKDFSLTTSKEQTIQTAATGLMIFEHSFKKNKNSFLDEEFSLHDGKLNTFILAPTSKLAYLYYLFMVFFLGKINFENLPKSLGVVKSSKLNIKSSKPMDFKLDGVLISSQEIDLQIKKDALNIAMRYESDKITQNTPKENEKDTIKIQNLPKGDMKNLLINEPVPLFKKADESEFKDLFLSLKESAKLSWVFIVLMILSTLLATTGLFQNSAPVIIGAMVLAPLMAPIVSLSMGIVRANANLIKNSSKTLFWGILTALIFSSILSMFLPLTTLTQEMRGRVNPNVLDLIVAIVSGIAGAYANSKSEVAKSLAGVAIAVALVPPLSVTGVAISWGDFDMFYGSFLLFITNLVGITLAASISFIILGYAPIHRAKKGILYTSIALSIITIPLVLSFYEVIHQNDILSKLNNKQYKINSKNIQIDVVEVEFGKKIPNVTLIIKSEQTLSLEDFKKLKHDIQKQLDQNITLNISSKVVIK